MPFAEIKPNLSMYYEDDCFAQPWRKPETILLLHGGGRSTMHYISWVPILSPHLRVLRVDLPGYGKTKRPAGHKWSLAGAARELVGLLDLLGVDAVHVGGDHLGSALSLQFAASYPSRTLTVEALVHGAACVGEFGANRRAIDQIRIVEQLRERGSYDENTTASRYGSRATPEMIEYWESNHSRDRGADHVDPIAAVAEADLPAVLKQIKAPTLLLVPNRNTMVPLKNVLDTANLIANAEVVVIASDSHDIAIAEPEVCATECLRFIQRRSALASAAG